MTNIQPSSALDFGLKDSGAQTSATPHNYSKIIVPTNGIDTAFNLKVAEIFQLSHQDPKDALVLSHLLAQCYAQMGSIYNPSLVAYMNTLQGNANELGAVPGYPQLAGLEFFDITNEQWSRLVMEFRHTAMLFYNAVSVYSEYFSQKSIELVFYRHISGGWVFYAAPRRFYDIA